MRNVHKQGTFIKPPKVKKVNAVATYICLWGHASRKPFALPLPSPPGLLRVPWMRVWDPPAGLCPPVSGSSRQLQFREFSEHKPTSCPDKDSRTSNMCALVIRH